MIGKIVAVITRLMLMAACLMMAVATAIGGVKFHIIAGVVAAGVVVSKISRGRFAGTSHGSARLGNIYDAGQSGLLGERGLILGRASHLGYPTLMQSARMLFKPVIPSRLACRFFLSALLRFGKTGDSLIRLNSYVHLSTFAATGRGKGVSLVVPNLLSCDESCVVVDIKGELARMTAEHRRCKLGHSVYILDPWGLSGLPSCNYNPLTFIDPKSKHLFDDLKMLAGLMVHRIGTEPDPFWADSAEGVIQAMLCLTCCHVEPEDKHLGTFRGLVASRDSYEGAKETMQQLGDMALGVVKRMGDQLSWHVEEELASVLAVVQQNTGWLDSPILAEQMKSSNFNPAILRKQKATIYLVLPQDRLAEYAALMRLWVGSILRAVVRDGADERKVMFIIDEAANMGRVALLEKAVSLYRGSGIRLWFFFQSLGQVQECYGKTAQSFLDNIDTQQFFGINSFESADAISKRIGDETIEVASTNRSTQTSTTEGPQSSRSTSYTRGSSLSKHGRRLIFPDEILRMGDDVSLVFHRNLPALPIKLLKYFDAPEFRRGRTGTPRGLGLAGGMAAAILLAVSIVLAGLAAVLPAPSRSIDAELADIEGRRRFAPPLRLLSPTLPGIRLGVASD